MNWLVETLPFILQNALLNNFRLLYNKEEKKEIVESLLTDQISFLTNKNSKNKGGSLAV
jgi:hypothetical protein